MVYTPCLRIFAFPIFVHWQHSVAQQVLPHLKPDLTRMRRRDHDSGSDPEAGKVLRIEDAVRARRSEYWAKGYYSCEVEP